jgi:hypothetical protein
MKALIAFLIAVAIVAIGFAQKHACHCGAIAVYLLTPSYVPEEGSPLEIDCKQDDRGRILVRLSCSPKFGSDHRMEYVEVLLADTSPPIVPVPEVGIGPLYAWCEQAQHGKSQDRFEIEEGKVKAVNLPVLAFRKEDASRVMLRANYESRTGSRIFWVPVAYFLKQPAAALEEQRKDDIQPNKSLQPTATAVMPRACARVTPTVAVAEH